MKLLSTSCETLFLGWDGPLLPRAAAALRERCASRDRFDLSGLLLVLPTASSVRRLDALLHREAETHGLHYDRPRIVTVGQLAERLYQPELPVALELEQTLAWARALRRQDHRDLEPLLPSVPSAKPIGPWLELAATLRRLHEDLSSSRRTFDDVVKAAETDLEKRRWKLLSKLFDDYRSELGQAGLCDPYTARHDAATQDRCKTDRTVVLIGTSDLSDALVAMLRGLDSHLIAMVAAPASEALRFNEFGRVEPSGWMEHALPIADKHLVSGGGIADQAAAVAESVAEFSSDFSPDQVTVGVTDESQVGPVEVQLRGCGVSTHRHLGWTISQTSVGRLLDLTAGYLSQPTWQSLAALVRHADVCRFVTHRLGQQDAAAWLASLDQLLSEFFPVRVRDPLSPKALESCGLAKAVGQAVEQWLEVYLGPDRTIARWSEEIEAWLGRLYEHPAPGEHDDHGSGLAIGDRTAMALESSRRVIRRFVKLNDHLDLTVSGAAALETLASRLGEVRVIGSAMPEDVEILGWLDLALDDAPAMAVIGLNHPFVPAAVTSDPFLPGSLRSRLRMDDNDRRYARDVYAMHLMLSTRTAIRFIVGRRAADQSPTPPSRLLAASDPSDSARRLRNLLGGVRPSVVVDHGWDQGPGQGLLPIPPLATSARTAQIQVMSVTAFRDYLACPYRFFLRHVLKLRPLDDASNELAANQFGDLVHGALERFGGSDDRDETDRAKIAALLIEHLHAYAAEHYGQQVSTAVTLQIAQAERRLKVAARTQAEWIAAGWKIHASEAPVDEQRGAGIDVDGKRMGLRGRLDRIDHHAETGQWAILDYKTHGHRPVAKHLKKTDDGFEWIDLQLPLYRMMIPFLGLDAADPSQVQVGYFNISEKDDETRINIAEFSEHQIEQAEQLVRDCIGRIWAGDFEPTKDRIQFDDYGMILQTGVASRLLDQVESGVGQEAEQ